MVLRRPARTSRTSASSTGDGAPPSPLRAAMAHALYFDWVLPGTQLPRAPTADSARKVAKRVGSAGRKGVPRAPLAACAFRWRSTDAQRFHVAGDSPRAASRITGADGPGGREHSSARWCRAELDRRRDHAERGRVERLRPSRLARGRPPTRRDGRRGRCTSTSARYSCGKRCGCAGRTRHGNGRFVAKPCERPVGRSESRGIAFLAWFQDAV